MTHSRSSCLKLTLVFVGLAAAVVPAAAQQWEPGRFSIGAGAGIAIPLHGDYDFTAGAWQAEARFEVSRHFAQGLFYEEWRHTDERVLTNQVVHGPGGAAGRIDRVTSRTQHVNRAVGWNVIAKAPLGRVTLSGGGGASYLLLTRDYSQTVTGCQSDLPGACTDVRTEYDNSDFSIQVHAGADVAVTPWIAVTGQFRVIVPVSDVAGGHMSLTGGVRFRL